ncbi:hypothetical protein PCCS19_51540 [Paenibacillus sp. CCS19]|uniref:hypothetical protein n=1 Tax=Paenibacillus sp. CCS19 TaxID=3158387 RepID=UPI002560EF9A|nr:hypothetical protein [Paenibacillus cellulosilyticus]GMK42095.1 hypothetical protein PCCS19_51540 [Paenibacillus cellulosilyticus]
MSSGISSISSEMSSIIRELESIEAGLRSNFEGIGSEVVSQRIRQFIEDVQRAQSSLNRVNPSHLSEAFLSRTAKK